MRAISRSKSLDFILPLHNMTQPCTVRCNGWQEDKGPPLVMASWGSGCSAKIIQEGIALSQANLTLETTASPQPARETKGNKWTFHPGSPADISRWLVLVEVSPSQRQLSRFSSQPQPELASAKCVSTPQHTSHIKSGRGIWFPKIFRKPPIKWTSPLSLNKMIVKSLICVLWHWSVHKVIYLTVVEGGELFSCLYCLKMLAIILNSFHNFHMWPQRNLFIPWFALFFPLC